MAVDDLRADAVGAPAEGAGLADGRRRSPGEVLGAASERFNRLDLRNTWQVAAGSLLVPLGVVVILIAWYGAAHASVVQQQIPYLVSGSFVGLGLMIVGGLMYWAHWLYRIYDQADLHHAERLVRDQQLFQLIEAALAGQTTPVPGAVHGVVPGVVAAGGTGSRELVATATGTNVHRADCPVALRHPEGLQRLSADEAAGRPPCRICRPLDD
ncbi:MAG TPA: hypothetical protein VFH50_06115 [Acidimicrobiales bacterium]|nr:hypothetical protein [Acidimicrobiales bacterium]